MSKKIEQAKPEVEAEVAKAMPTKGVELMAVAKKIGGC